MCYIHVITDITLDTQNNEAACNVFIPVYKVVLSNRTVLTNR